MAEVTPPEKPTSSGSWTLKGVLFIIMSGLIMFFRMLAKKAQIEGAKKETEEGRVQDEVNNAVKAEELQQKVDEATNRLEEVKKVAADTKGGKLPKHENSGQCPRCQLILGKTYAPLRAWFENVQRIVPETHISDAGRGRNKQEEYFSKGLSKAHFGESAHNYWAALDLFEMGGDDIKNIYEKKWFEKKLKPLLNEQINWYGMPGSKFYELPHVEWKQWRELRDKGVLGLVE